MNIEDKGIKKIKKSSDKYTKQGRRNENGRNRFYSCVFDL